MTIKLAFSLSIMNCCIIKLKCFEQAFYLFGKKSYILLLLLSCFSHVQLLVTLWIVARQSPLSMGFSRQEYWNGLPCHPSRDLPNPRITHASLMSPALAGRFFTTSAT